MGMTVEVILKGYISLSISLSNGAKKNCCDIYGVYAPNNRMERQELWLELSVVMVYMMGLRSYAGISMLLDSHSKEGTVILLKCVTISTKSLSR